MKVAEACLLVAGERSLRDLAVEHGKDLFVGDATHLVVVLDHFAVLIADTILSSFHQSIASRILSADVAIDTSPALIAVASIAGSYRSVFASC